MWCNPCRAVGMIHCAHPDECGNMLSHEAAADNWKAWLDDLPLHAGFAEGIGQVQNFISGTTARAEAAEAALIRAKVGLVQARDELDQYSRQEYQLDHPAHERCRQRDYEANPARLALDAIEAARGR